MWPVACDRLIINNRWSPRILRRRWAWGAAGEVPIGCATSLDELISPAGLWLAEPAANRRGGGIVNDDYRSPSWHQWEPPSQCRHAIKSHLPYGACVQFPALGRVWRRDSEISLTVRGNIVSPDRCQQVRDGSTLWQCGNRLNGLYFKSL